MKAYVELVQRKEREIDCDVLTHQRVCRLLCTIAFPPLTFHSVVEWRRVHRQHVDDCDWWYLFNGCDGQGRDGGSIYHQRKAIKTDYHTQW